MAQHWRRWQRVAAGVIVGLALVGVGYGLRSFTTSATSAKSFVLVPRTLTVSETSASQQVAASGTVEPSQDQTVDFLTSGTVASVEATVGEAVTPSTLLASLDTAPLQAAQAQAQAQLTAAETKLTADQDAAAPSATIQADQATVTADTTALDTAKQNLSDASLYAPFDGTVTAVDLATGQSVGPSSGGSATKAQTVGITIESSSSWVVNAAVSDANISGVQDSEQATVSVQGTSSNVYGTVTSVGLVATTSSGVATFPVTISVTGDPKGLYAGLPATVSIVTKVEPDVIEIPTLAVHSLSSSPYVLESTRSGQRKVPISVGSITGAEVVVTKGLASGDKIVEDVPSFAGATGTTSIGRGAFGRRGAFGGGGAFGG
ncbi:MAG: efflux RND transporter periplasmic adaptor subunit [Ferrimicrobium sp.]|jgi:macrolide-specific efflux system membrane fusion protein|nr:efflux RND transporter periplasmic adaptor subunit [Ferrimicrobium sp.]